MAVSDSHLKRERQRALGSLLAHYRRTHVPKMRQIDLGSRIGYARQTVSNAEIGRDVPARDFWTAADECTGAAGALIDAFDEFVRMFRSGTRTNTEPGLALPVVDGARARDHATVFASADVPVSVIGELERDASRLAREYATAAPGDLLRSLERTRVRTTAVLDAARRPAATGRLLRVGAAVCGLAATTAFDTGDGAAASDFAAAAHLYADAADDDVLRGWARSVQGTLAFWRGDPRMGLDYAVDGLSVAAGDGAARLHAIAARSHALMGDPESARRSLDDASAAIAGSVSHLPGELAFSPVRLALCTAAVYTAIGDGPAAAEAATEAMAVDAGLPAPQRRFAVAAAARMELAAAHVTGGHIEAVPDVLAPALALDGKRRTTRLLRRLRALEDRVTIGPVSRSRTGLAVRAQIEHFHTETTRTVSA